MIRVWGKGRGSPGEGGEESVVAGSQNCLELQGPQDLPCIYILGFGQNPDAYVQACQLLQAHQPACCHTGPLPLPPPAPSLHPSTPSCPAPFPFPPLLHPLWSACPNFSVLARQTLCLGFCCGTENAALQICQS